MASNKMVAIYPVDKTTDDHCVRFAKQAPILILDDSASALDFATGAGVGHQETKPRQRLYRVATGSFCAVCRLNSRLDEGVLSWHHDF